jgi:hypothetical protein
MTLYESLLGRKLGARFEGKVMRIFGWLASIGEFTPLGKPETTRLDLFDFILFFFILTLEGEFGVIISLSSRFYLIYILTAEVKVS